MDITIINHRPATSPYDEEGRIDFSKLGQALHWCQELPLLQNSELAELPNVVVRSRDEKGGLEQAKALRKELVDCAEQITLHTRHISIREVLAAIEREKLFSERYHVVEIQRRLGIPFSRNKLHLARYYAIRLLMEGLSNDTIADFLQVERRTLGNYISEAKERIRLALESRLESYSTARR